MAPPSKRYQYQGDRFPLHQGEWFTLVEWAEIEGSTYKQVYDRVTRRGGGVIVDPKQGHRRSLGLLEYRGTAHPDLSGQEFTIIAFAHATGEHYDTIQKRVARAGGTHIPDGVKRK